MTAPQGSPDPRDLWKYLTNYEEKTGGEVLAARRASLSCPESINPTPWQAVYRSTVRQLAEGADMAFEDQPLDIIARSDPPRHSH
jgi:hypothetical protein